MSSRISTYRFPPRGLARWLLPLACLLLAACAGGGPPGGGSPAPQWPPEAVHEGPPAALEKLSTSVGEVPRGLPRVATDGTGGALAVWPLWRAGAAENGGDLYLLHYSAFDPATGTWGPEQEVPGYTAGTSVVFSDQVPNARVERVLGGSAGVLLAWRQFSGPDLFLHLAVYRNGLWSKEAPIPLYAEGPDPDTGLTTVNEVILDAVATDTGFVVLTGRTIHSAGEISEYWVRRMVFEGSTWTNEGLVAREGIFIPPGEVLPIDTNRVLDTVSQNGRLTGIQLRRFEGAIESPSVRIIDAAGTVSQSSLPSLVPPEFSPGQGDIPLRFKTLQSCGDRFVTVASSTDPSFNDSVWAIAISPGVTGGLRRIGVPRETFHDVDVASNALGCMVVYRRLVGSGAAHNIWGTVFRNGVWGPTQYLQYVLPGGTLQATANDTGYAVLFASPVRGQIWDYFAVREQDGIWSLGTSDQGATQGIHLFTKVPIVLDTMYTPVPNIVPVDAHRFAVTWIDATGQPRAVVSGGIAGGSVFPWPEADFGATPDMAIRAGSTGGGGKLFMAWTSPFSAEQAGMATVPPNSLIGSMEHATLRPTAPASKLATAIDTVNGDSLTTWYQPQYQDFFSRVHSEGVWQGAAPDIADARGAKTRHIYDGNLFTVVSWVGNKVKAADLPLVRSTELPDGDWTELTSATDPGFVFNIETAASNGRMALAWEQVSGIHPCNREAGGLWACNTDPLFDGYLASSQGNRMAAGPNGFVLLMDGKQQQGNTTFASVFENGRWRLPVELGVTSGWVVAAGNDSYAAATTAGKRVDIRHYLDGEWQTPLVVGPMQDTVRNVRLMPRAGGGYALFFQVGTGTAHTWGAVYYAGRWSAPVDLGPGKLAAAAARPEGFLAVIDSYDEALNQVYVLKHYDINQLRPLPARPEWAGLKFLPQVAVGPYSDAALATRNGVLYGLRLWPGSDGNWDDPIPLNQPLVDPADPLPVPDARVAMSGANFMVSWLQAVASDRALPHVWATGFSGTSGP